MPTKTGPYVDKGKDPIRQGDKGDKPAGSGRELDIEVIERHSNIPGGASGPLPRKM